MAEPYKNPDIQDAEDFLRSKRIADIERKLTDLEKRKQAKEADRPWFVPRLKELGARAGESFLTPFSWVEKGAMKLAGQGGEGGPITRAKDVVSALAEDFGKEARGPKAGPYVPGSTIFTDPTSDRLKLGGDILGMAPFGGPAVRGGLRGLQLAKEGLTKVGLPSGLLTGAEEFAELPENPDFSDIMHSGGKVLASTAGGTLLGGALGRIMKTPRETPPQTNTVAPGSTIPTKLESTIPQSVVEPPTAPNSTLPPLPKEPVGELPPLRGEEPNLPVENAGLEQTAGWNFPITPRIGVDPIRGEQPSNIRDILKTVREKLKIAHTAPGGIGGRTLGQYEPWNASTKNRFYSDLDTALHESSHALDDRYGIMAPWKFADVSPYDHELQKFWPHGSAAPNRPPWYNRAEGVAEYARAWMVNPTAAEQAAPQFTAHFLSKVPPADLDAMKELGRQVRVFRGAQLDDPASAIAATQAPVESSNPIIRWFRKGQGELFAMKWTDDLQTGFIDSLHPFQKAIDQAKQITGKKVLPENDPSILARLYSGRFSKQNYIFDRGQMDAKGNIVPGTEGGLKSLFAPLDQSSVESFQKDMQDVTTLMRSQRVVDEWMKLPPNERLSGRIAPFGAGMEPESLTSLRAIEQLKQNPERFERLTEAAKRYRKWADANLRILVEKHRMSPAEYLQIKKDNQYYVAMNRLMEIAPDEEIVMQPRRSHGGNLGTPQQPVHHFEGSAKPLKDAYQSLMEQTAKAHSEADRNQIMLSFVDLMQTGRGMYSGEPKALGAIAQKVPEGTANSIKVFRNGVAEHWLIDDEVLKTLKTMGDTVQPLLGKFDPFRWSSRLLRETVTHTPTFAIRNRIRDTTTRLILSRNGGKLADSFKALTEEEIDNLRKHGGDMAGYYMTDEPNYNKWMASTMKEMVNDKQGRFIIADPAKLAKGYNEWIMNSERANRVAEYKAAFNKAKSSMGYDDYNAHLYAASQARDLMDFATVGTYIKPIAQYSTFLGARIRGVGKAVERMAENPERVLPLWAMWAAAPSMAVYAIHQQAGTLEEYRQLPTYIRDQFWVLPAGPNQWVTIPKPFELGVMATSVERAIDAANGGEHPFGNPGPMGIPEHAMSAISAFSPVNSVSAFMPPVISGAVEGLTNYNFFKQQHIVPPHEEKLDLELRKHAKESSSRLGGWIQDAIGVDARKVDSFLEHQFGYAGRYATNLSDIGREHHGFGMGTDRDRTRTVGTITGLGRETPVAGTLDVEWVQDFANRRGMTGKKWFKQFKALKSDVYKAQTSEDKAAAMKALRERAAQLRKEYDK